MSDTASETTQTPAHGLSGLTSAAARPAGTATVAESAELAVVVRGDFVESRHAGSAIVLGRDAAVLRSIGDPDALVFGRSSLKSLQTLANVSAGAELEGVELAVASASHSGTPAHVAAVKQILAKAQLPVSALQCPAVMPADAEARAGVRALGEGPSPVFHECSGKHAAMLLACVTNGWDVATYLDPEHPVQKAAVDTIERLTGEKVAAVAVDGCGAPTFAVSLTGLARGIQRIATAQAGSPFPLYKKAAAITRAVRDFPWAVHGQGLSDSVMVERLGVFAKRGAEGLLVAAAPDGTTVALKVLDGAHRPATVVALTLLVKAGALSAASVAALLPEVVAPVVGGGRTVGEIRPVI
ncbi:MAG: asparaginase [Microbacteriaceae bacterium]|nr:asparaginase [Microbacteriaceae bacterium]MCL2795483.1 asparaginase [Microbacteriaceae bacterium]